jgi:4-alpha-glucanotransferase
MSSALEMQSRAGEPKSNVTLSPLAGKPAPKEMRVDVGLRASGVLLHITSLPSPYGIGDMGPAAFAWVDQLHEAGQSWWQALPLGPTGYGDSPYQALSSFAGNGLLISPELLLEDGLLDAKACEGQSFSSNAVDYGAVIQFKHRLLDQIWGNFSAGNRKDLRPDYEMFCHRQAHWLEDYSLFRALKQKFHGVSYLDWPAELVRRTPTAIAQARQESSQLMDRVRFAQFLIFKQAQRLKEYARSRGVGLIGDLPFFVSPDSSDVWAHPELFLLDKECRPRFVAGVPPDYFSEDGQLWGNPVYDWDALRQTGFRFYIDRLLALLAHVDVIRLDHFRAFAGAWHVPADAKTARTGCWVPGPGSEFFRAVQEEVGFLPFIAEDLGVITPDVCALRDEFGIPGTKVLQFAFDGNPGNPHLPENFSTNTVVYTGTHDNNTTRGWFEALPDSERRRVWTYLNRADGDSYEIAGELLRVAWSSVAALAIAPLQDLLNLGAEARMNLPGSTDAHWRWRATDKMLHSWIFHRLRDVTTTSHRLHVLQGEQPASAVRAAS